MEEETRFTVFCDDGFWPSHGNETPDNLLKLIAYAVAEDPSHPPLAWAAEAVRTRGGAKGWRDLKAESIAAGRVINFVDGKYIPRGTPEANAEEAQAIQRMERNRTREVADRNCAMRPSDEIPPAPLPVEKVGGFDAFKGWAPVIKGGEQQDSYCVCRNHHTPGVVHRSDGPCYFMEHTGQTTTHAGLVVSPDLKSASHQVHYEHGSAVFALEKKG